MKKYFYCIILFWTVFTVTHALETMVPFDSTGTIMTIDKQLESKYNLFAEYPTLIKAQIFQNSADSLYLEITYEKNNAEVRERFAITTAQLQQIRNKIYYADYSILNTELTKEAIRDTFLYNDDLKRGNLLYRTNFLWLSCGYYGIGIPISLEASGAAGPGTYLLVAGSSIVYTYMHIKKQEITMGDALLANNFSYRGIAHGIAVGYLFGCHHSKMINLSSTLFSFAENRYALTYAHKHKFTEDDAAVLTLFHDQSTMETTALAFAVNLYQKPENRKWAGALTLFGSMAGIHQGLDKVEQHKYSCAHAKVGQLSSLMYGLAACTILNKITNNDFITAQRDYSIAALIGMNAGMIEGLYVTNKYHLTSSEASNLIYCTLGGGVAGCGLNLILDEGKDARKIVRDNLFVGSVGALIGYHIYLGSIAMDTDREVQTKQHVSAYSIKPYFNPMLLNSTDREPFAGLVLKF